MGRLRELAEEKRKALSQGSMGDFRELAQMKKNYNKDELDSLNNEYINSFVNDANTYFKALNDAYTGLNWSNANDTTDSITKQWEALEKRKNTIGVWLLNNKGNLDTESYNSLAESIKNLSQGGADSVKAFKDANALYSSFASQGDYDKWYSNYTAKQNEINSVLNADDFEKYSELGGNAEYYTPWYLGLGQSLNSDDLKYVKVNGKEEKFNQYTLKQEFDAVATDEEKKLYNYYLGKYGAEKATQYLENVAEDVNYRRGQQIFDKIKDSTLAQLGYSAVAGLDSFVSGLGNVGQSVIGLFKDGEQKPLPTTAIQYASGMVRDDLANEGFKIGKQSISQIAYDLGNTTANQIPSMAIGAMTSPVVGAVLMGVSAGGNAYKEMKDLGYTDGQATTYGMITGALEGVLGNILGGISGIGKNLLGKTAMKSLAKGVNSAAFRAALNFGSEIVSEGIEEGLQEVLSPFVKAIATGDEFDGVDWSEVGYSAVLGALSAGMLNSVSSIPGTVGTLNTANNIKKANKVDELKQIANTYAPETVAYKIADKVKADTGAFGIARLLYEVNGRLTAQNTTDIREALKDSGYVDKDADTVAEWLAKAVEGQPLTRKQQIALENNPIITKVFADIVLDETSIVNQRAADVERINDTKVEKKTEKTEAVNENTVPERGEEVQQTPEAVEVENEAEIVDDRSRESLLLALQRTDYDELTKTMLADAYDGNYSIGEYLTAAREGYDYGLVGLENESIPTDGLYKSILSPSQQKTSYELGVAKAKGIKQTRERNVASKRKYGVNKTGRKEGTVSGANVSLSQMRAKFNDQQNRAYKVISRIAEATGINVVFYASKADADGRYNGAQGKFTWKNDTIYIDINSGLFSEANATDLANYTMLRTFTHEFVHFIEKYNAEGYNELRRVVFKTLSERGENVDELITNAKTEYGFKDDAKGSAYDKASREVVAEALAEILPDSNLVEQLAMKNPNVFRSLLEQLKQFIADIKEYFSEMGKVNYRGAEGLKTEVDGTVKYLENIVELFDKVAVDAVENYQAQFDDGVNSAINLLAESSTTPNDQIEQGDDGIVQELKRDVNNNKATYDYTKPFSEQIDDYTHNLTPKYDTLLVGDTPAVWRKVGFNPLPITINQKHVEYALYGTKDYDHHIGEAMLKSLPDLIKDPVAIIQSQSPTRNDRIVVILNMMHNGSNVIGAIEVDGEGIINNILIDSNALTSLFSKQNAIAQLHTALQNTVNGAIELFYWNKKQARALLQNKGLQLPNILPQDGFVYSIHHNRSNVKPKFKDVTESKQFKRWFGDWQNKPKSSSKVVNANGTPKLVYHYTNNKFTTFDATKNGANQGQSHGDGIYLSTSQSAYNYAGNYKMVLYANIKKPFEMNLTRKQADYILKKYASIKHDLDAYGSMYYKHAIVKLMSPSRVFDYLKEYAGDNSINVSDILKDLGYDGIHDGNVWVAFDSNQVKSATDNIGTFDADNPDIRYQLRTKPLTDTEILRMAMEKLDTDEYTESEKVTIRSLNAKLDKLAELEAQRTELGQLYKEQRSDKNGDRNEAIKTYNQMRILDKQINKNRTEILSIEDKQMFRTILQKARKVVETEQKQYDAQKYKDAKARQAETARKSKYREIIRADVNELVKWLTKPDDKKGNRIPDVIKNPIISILRSIDTSSPRLFKGNPVKATKDYRENLKKLQSAFQSEIDAGKLYSGYLDLPEGFMDGLKNMIYEADSLKDYSREGVNIAEGLNVAVAELNQLKVWAKFLNEIKQWVTKTDKLLANSIFQHVSDAADTTIKDLAKQKDAGKNTGGLYKLLNWTQPRASWIWERFGEGGKAIEKGFIDAQSKLAKNTEAIINFRKKTYTQKEAQKWINEINTVKLHGNEIQMPTSYLMGLYLLSKQEDSVRHLTNGGFRVGTFTRKGKKYYDNTEHSFGSVQELNSFLDEYFSAEKFAREREVADQIQSFMAKQGAEWGNYVSVARFGEKRFTNPDYYPINSDGKLLESTVDEMPNGAEMYALLNLSQTKARNEKATNRIIVYDMFDVFSNHVSAMAQYNAFALPILDALKWFNYKSDISSVRDEIRRVFGAPEEGGKGSGKEGFAETFVKNIIRAYSGTESMGTAVDEMGMRGLRLHNMAQIAYNVRVVVQQPLSIIRAGVVLNSKYLLKAIKTPLPTTLKSTAEMLEHSGTAVWKDLGFYDINISRGVADIVKGADNWRDKISDIGMKGAEFADKVAWTTMWNACKAQVEAQNPSLARGSDAYWAKVNELFDEVIYKTQVVDTVLTKSEFMRNKGFWSRAMSSFMSEPIASYSMCMGEFDKFNADVKRGLSWNEAFKRNAKSIARTTAIYSISAIMLSAVTAAMDAARDDDEYEELSEKWWDAFRGNLIDELVPLNKLPIFSDLYEILKILLSKMGVDTYGNPPQSIFAQWHESLVKGVEILYDKTFGEGSNYTYYGGIYKLLQFASSAVGLPIAPLTREVITAWNNSIGRIDPKYKVKSYDSGDLNNIKYAFKDGKLTEDEAIKHILDKGLADNSTIGAENEAYFMVQGWEYGEGYSRYDKLYSAAIDGDGSYHQAIAELTSHGYEEKKIRTALQTELSRRFKNGTVSWTTAYLVLTQYCDKTKEDAEKLLYNWENA